MKKIILNHKFQMLCIVLLTGIFSLRVYTKTVGAITVANPYLETVSWITMILGIVLVGVVSYLTLVRKKEIHQVYPIVGLVLGIIFILVIPIYGTPDETFHFDAAYNLSNRMLGVEPSQTEGKEYRRKCDTEYHVLLFRKNSYRKFGVQFKGDIDTQLVLATDRSGGDANIAAYVIPALGISLGRLLRLNFPMLSMLGMLFNTMWFVLWMTYALKKIPYGQRILLTVALLPITLQEVNSYSRDNPLLIASILVIVLTLHWHYSEEKIKISEAIIFVVSAYTLVTVKSALYAYMVLFPLVILMKKEWFTGKNKKYALAGLAGIVVLAFLFFVPMHGWDRIYQLLSTESYVEHLKVYGQAPLYYVMHPVELIIILARTVKKAMWGYILQLVGHGLGWLEVYNSDKDHWAYIIPALLVAIRMKGEDIRIDGRTRVFSVLTGVIGIVFCMLAMLVFWNPKNPTTVDGLQGRYFVPVLLPLFLGLGYWKKPVLKINLNQYHPILLAGMGYVIAVNILRYNVGV